MILDDGVIQIILPDSLEWVDEYDWSDVKQDITDTLGGGLVVQESLVVTGRPITLESGENVWVVKSVLDALIAQINLVDKTYTLTMPDLTVHTVIFDRRSGSPYSAKPVWRKNVHETTAYFTLTLKFIKV